MAKTHWEPLAALVNESACGITGLKTSELIGSQMHVVMKKILCPAGM